MLRVRHGYVETKVKVTVAESRPDNVLICSGHIVYIKEGLENTLAPFAP